MANPGKLVWITGASQGIGAALASAMASAGWRVAITARSADDLATVAAAFPGRVYPFAGDITDRPGMVDLIHSIEASHGPIDVAVFNAGTHKPLHLTEMTLEDYDRLISLNITGTLNGFVPMAQTMAARGRGHVAVVSSVAGLHGLPTSAGYGLTKAGLINMMQALKPELDRAGVKSQVILPGFVRTPLTDKNTFEMPFLMEPAEAAQAILRGLKSRRFEVLFPWQMAVAFAVIRHLPEGLRFRLLQKLIPDDAPAPSHQPKEVSP